MAKDIGALPGSVGVRSRPFGCSQGPWGHAQGTRGLGARPGVVGMWPRPCGRGQGHWGHCLGRGSAAKAFGSVAYAVEGVQDRGGAAMGRGGAAKAVSVQPGAVGARLRPWERGQGPWGHGKGGGAAARGRGCVANAVG